MFNQILANRIRTPDGTVLQSFGRHDYKNHIDKVTGETYAIDGGIHYVRRSVNKVPATDISVYTSDPFAIIRKAFHWGSYGIKGDEELKYTPLMKLTDLHINAILRTQVHIPEYIRNLFSDELSYRKNTQGECDV